MEKRALPTRHNFLTEAVQQLLESTSSSTEPTIDSTTLITVTSDEQPDSSFIDYGPSNSNSNSPKPISAEHVARVKIITPVRKRHDKENLDLISDDYYIKRHRKHELDEKKQKNREKERLRHGYYQQSQLVERIKTMDKGLLRSIVSSIRHRGSALIPDMTEEAEEEYLNKLHERLLKDATELLRRYEALGLAKTSTAPPTETEETESLVNPTFHEAVQTEAIRQRARQLATFEKYPSHKSGSSRYSKRHITAFGEKLPPFEFMDFQLPKDIFGHLMNSR
ncbi:hypothetical protein RMCBS344292_09124 [Rhizopus microsporus]|nr:hypothetical protein RMCBS344292_09124 [Rhizopus microsporus]